MKIVELLGVTDKNKKTSLYLEVEDKDFDKFIEEFKFWRDRDELDVGEDSLLDFLHDQNIDVRILQSDFVISVDCDIEYLI